MKKANNLPIDRPAFSFARLFGRNPLRATFQQRPSLVPFAAAMLLIFGLVFGGWGTVYAAQGSQPDDLLYPVKLAVDYLEDLATGTNPNYSKDCVTCQKQDRDREVYLSEDPNDWPPHKYSYGQDESAEDQEQLVLLDEPIAPIEEPIDETIPPPVEEPIEDHWMWGPGSCEWDESETPGQCELGYQDPFGPWGPYEGNEDETPGPELRRSGEDRGYNPVEPSDPPDPVGDGGDGDCKECEECGNCDECGGCENCDNCEDCGNCECGDGNEGNKPGDDDDDDVPGDGNEGNKPGDDDDDDDGDVPGDGNEGDKPGDDDDDDDGGVPGDGNEGDKPGDDDDDDGNVPGGGNDGGDPDDGNSGDNPGDGNAGGDPDDGDDSGDAVDPGAGGKGK